MILGQEPSMKEKLIKGEKNGGIGETQLKELWEIIKRGILLKWAQILRN
jgi:hypothetical protein